MVITVTQEAIGEAFSKWKTEYDADPDNFASHESFLSTAPGEYGPDAAATLLGYLAVEVDGSHPGIPEDEHDILKEILGDG